MGTSGKGMGAIGEALSRIDLDGVADAQLRDVVRQLMTFLELTVSKVAELEVENQRLKDEINRLKGEHGKPAPRLGKGTGASQDHSSEKERHTPKTWSKGAKNASIKIDRTETLPNALEFLPDDAEFKGYDEVLVQNLVIETDNVLFRRPKWYSPSERKTYVVALPAGYEGGFGPGVKALVLVLYHGANTSEPAIVELLHNVGIQISTGQVSNLLIKDQDEFHTEKGEVAQAGLASSKWQHMDDTETSVNGERQHCMVVCNPLYAAYSTVPKKDRQSVIDVLSGSRPRQFLLDEQALGLVALMGLSTKRRIQLATLPQGILWSEAEVAALLKSELPGLGETQRRWILDALAIAAYRAATDWPVLDALVCDDAPQWTLITQWLALCWVHEGRHFKKLAPFFAGHRRILEKFLTDFWAYYRQLVAYRAHPTPPEAERLCAEFDRLFSTETGYSAIDQRLPRIRRKKDSLLLVLAHPEIPLHNNPAELDVRTRVRKRDVSFGPRTPEGVRAWDTFMTLAATSRKLNVSFFHYINDRIAGKDLIPRLADIIRARAPDLNLDASWT